MILPILSAHHPSQYPVLLPMTPNMHNHWQVDRVRQSEMSCATDQWVPCHTTDEELSRLMWTTKAVVSRELGGVSGVQSG